jgi:2-haloacid dehalogenase
MGKDAVNYPSGSHPIKAWVFDAYGTLFDVHSPVGKHRLRLGEVAEPFSNLWRSKQLEYTWLRSLMRCHADFWRVTQDALDYALNRYGIADNSVRRDLLEAYLRLDCYPEVPEVLRHLKSQSHTTAILSNATPFMLMVACNSAGVEKWLDHLISVESVGVYKPDPRVYRLAAETLHAEPREISFQTANAWDAVGAAAFGFRVVWVNRLGQPPEKLPFQPAIELNSLSELL